MQDGSQNEPGWVFKPGDTPEQANVTPDNPPNPSTSQSEEPSLPPTPTPETSPAPVPQPNADYPHIEWTASEYIAHQKSAGWYGLLALGSIGIAAVVYFVTNGDLIYSSVIVILGLSLGIFAARQPRELQYAIDHTGIHIGEKFYPYQSFKTFSVVRDQGIGYISLAPLRRFMPPLTVHYDPADEDNIAETLSQYLPYDDHKPDITDIISRKIRF